MVKHSKMLPFQQRGTQFAAPKEEGAQHVEHLVACPVLTQDIGRVFGTRYVLEIHNLSGDRFPYTVIREDQDPSKETIAASPTLLNHPAAFNVRHDPVKLGT